jgi:arabinogalactan oligomer / maltooligosaccharide transport system substrate-binding protein
MNEDGSMVSVMSDGPAKAEDTSFLGRQRLGGKSLWDWLDMLSKLAIPAVLGVAALVFNSQQAQSAQDQQQASILQTYIGNMQDLLLKYKMSTSKPGDEVRLVAKEQTVATLQRLNAQRNEIVLNFLRANLTVIDLGVIDLSGADLSGASLSGDDLSGANLGGANLSGANLSGATLAGASLNYAILTGADLTGAHLSNANFTDADLTDARLDGATLTSTLLSGANLSGANLTVANLSGANLNGAKLNNTNLSGGNLRYAILENADLGGAELSGADLTGPDPGDVNGADTSTRSKPDGTRQCADTILSVRLLYVREVCHYSPIVLTYWYTESGKETDVVNELIKQFEKKYPGIVIHPMQKSFFGTETGYITAAQSGQAPDILRSDVGWITLFASKGYLLNIDSYVRQSGLDLSDYRSLNPPLGQTLSPDGTKFSPLAYDEYNGHLYGLPQVTDVLALLYNKAELNWAGITTPPSTMDALEYDAIKVVQKERGKPRSQLQYGFETNGQSYYTLPFLYANGGGMFDKNDTILVNSEGSVKGLSFLMGFQTNAVQVMPPDEDYSIGTTINGVSEMTTDFMNGKTAMIFDGPWDLSTILKTKSSKFFRRNNGNLGIAPIPMGPAGQVGSPLGGQSYVISASTEYPYEAYEFISFMSSKSSQEKIAETNDTLPTLGSVAKVVASENPYVRQFLSIWENEAVARPVIPDGAYLFDAFDPSIWAALDGVQSPSEALQAVADSWKQLGVQNQVP